MIRPVRVPPLVTLIVCVLLLLAARGAAAQVTTASPPTPAPPPLPDVTRLGPQVGSLVPSFSLPDQDGTVRTLASLQGPQGLMLVFFRSADW